MKLSVLLPAYNYPEGVIKILNFFKVNKPSFLEEIIISDDSTNGEIEKSIKCFLNDKDLAIKYIKQCENSSGAVNNWNRLLLSASSDYVWMIHHDDFPTCSKFIDNNFLLSNKSSYILPLMLKKNNKTKVKNKKHRKMGIRYMQYLFPLINSIGPVSSCILKRKNLKLFDPNYAWIVDSIFFLENKKIIQDCEFISDIQIVSDQDYAYSITKGLDNLESNYVKEIFRYKNGSTIEKIMYTIYGYLVRIFFKLYSLLR